MVFFWITSKLFHSHFLHKVGLWHPVSYKYIRTVFKLIKIQSLFMKLNAKLSNFFLNIWLHSLSLKSPWLYQRFWPHILLLGIRSFLQWHLRNIGDSCRRWSPSFMCEVVVSVLMLFTAEAVWNWAEFSRKLIWIWIRWTHCITCTKRNCSWRASTKFLRLERNINLFVF